MLQLTAFASLNKMPSKYTDSTLTYGSYLGTKAQCCPLNIHRHLMEGWSLVEMAAYSLIISFDKAVSSHFHKTQPFHWNVMSLSNASLKFVKHKNLK